MKFNYDPVRDRWNKNTCDILPRHDVVFGTPVHDPTYGLPIGDGDTGCLLWVTENSVKIHINKTDLWDDTTSDNRDYCSGEEENLTPSSRRRMHIASRALFEMLYQEIV